MCDDIILRPSRAIAPAELSHCPRESSPSVGPFGLARALKLFELESGSTQSRLPLWGYGKSIALGQWQCPHGFVHKQEDLKCKVRFNCSLELVQTCRFFLCCGSRNVPDPLMQGKFLLRHVPFMGHGIPLHWPQWPHSESGRRKLVQPIQSTTT